MNQLTSREFDVVIFGATSFTARLSIQYLIDTYGPSASKIKYCLAGRSMDRLQTLVQELNLPSTTPLRVCTLQSNALRALCRETQVLINFVGPFASLGDVVVQSCLEEYTHYIDISGEIDWCYSVGTKYHQMAAERGVKILPCMGYDYTAFEMGMAFLHNACQAQWSKSDVIIGTKTNSKGISSGTMNTIVRIIEFGDSFPVNEMSKKAAKKNQFLLPKFDHGLMLSGSLMGPGSASYLEWLNVGVLRQRWTNQAHGNGIELLVGEEHSTYYGLLVSTMKLFYIWILCAFTVALPHSLREYIIPSNGQGPSFPENGFVTSTFKLYPRRCSDSNVPTSESPSAVVNFEYQQGEAYQMTGVTAVESALTIVMESREDSKSLSLASDALLPKRYIESGGVGAGSCLLGDAYRQRLDKAGLHFRISTNQSA